MLPNGCVDGSAAVPKPRKLVLHMDIRNTVLVADSVTNVNMEEALNSYLTSVAWGFVSDGEWSWCEENPRPTLKKPFPDAISYYKFLEQSLVKVPEDRGNFRKITGDFVETKMGEKFDFLYEKYLKMLESTSLVLEDGTEQKMYHYLLPAFLHLLTSLEQAERDFCVIFRTYGQDAPNVLLACEEYLKAMNSSVQVHEKVLYITRTTDPSRLIVLHNGDGHTVTDEYEIYQTLTCMTGVNAVVGDFNFWLCHQYRHDSGKPFWIFPADSGVQHIIFDDNLRVEDIDSIVDVRLGKVTERGVTFQSLFGADIQTWENVCLVQVDLLAAIEDINYFVNLLEICDRKYAAHCSGSSS